MNKYIQLLKTMPLVQALWWYIENVPMDHSNEFTDVFFYLRERYRKENQRNESALLAKLIEALEDIRDTGYMEASDCEGVARDTLNELQQSN